MNDRKVTRSAWGIGMAVVVLAACSPDREEHSTVLGALAGSSDYSTLVAALQKADMVAPLDDPAQRFTVFAPNNRAFEQMLVERGFTTGLDGMTAAQLKPLLRYHVLAGDLGSDAAMTAALSNAKIDALGGKIQLSEAAGLIRLDALATLILPDLLAKNGVIHGIDRVIFPSVTDVATTDPNFSSWVAAATRADTLSPSPNLVATLDDDAQRVTLFAPTNEGFAALVNALRGNDDGATTGINSLASFRPDQLAPVLSYHLMRPQVVAEDVPTTLTAVDSLGGKLAIERSGAPVIVDGVQVIAADIYASNGVIHVINRVLLPSITDQVTTDPQFSSLKNAVLTADFPASTRPKVAATLDGPTRYTFFAPSNAAFAALSPVPDGQALTNVLLYHAAIEGAPIYYATALQFSTPVQVDTALSNRSLSVFAQTTGAATYVRVADSTETPATVIVVNYFNSNGVIHVVDRVLIPPP